MTDAEIAQIKSALKGLGVLVILAWLAWTGVFVMDLRIRVDRLENPDAKVSP